MRTANFLACVAVASFCGVAVSAENYSSRLTTAALHNDGDNTGDRVVTYVDLEGVVVSPLGPKLEALLKITVVTDTTPKHIIEIIPEVSGLPSGKVRFDVRSNTPERQAFAHNDINCKVYLDNGVNPIGSVTVAVDGIIYQDKLSGTTKKFVHFTWQLIESQIDISRKLRRTYCCPTRCGCRTFTKTFHVRTTVVHPCDPDDELLIPQP